MDKSKSKLKFHIDGNYLVCTTNNELKQVFKGYISTYNDKDIKNNIRQKIISNDFTINHYENKIYFEYTFKYQTESSLFTPSQTKISNNGIMLNEHFPQLSEFEIPENLKYLFLSLEHRISYLENRLDHAYRIVEELRLNPR
jgi:hypothetical protein